MPNKQANEFGFEELTREIVGIADDVKKLKGDQEESIRALRNEFDGKSAVDNEARSKVEEITTSLTATTQQLNALEERQREIVKTLENPIYQTQRTLDEHDKEAVRSMQLRVHLHQGRERESFKFNPENVISLTDYRSAALKLQTVGIDTREQIARTFTDGEKRAFAASGLDGGFFIPEMLGYVEDCEVECASMLDLYGSVTVNRSTFKYLQIKDHGAMGSYTCPASCDAELGEAGNMAWLNGSVHDFRGAFCLNKSVVAEANVDLLGFIIEAARRSHRINRNKAFMIGDGKEMPKGWMGAFGTRLTAKAGEVNHVDVRSFLGSLSREYGNVVPVMHPHVFAMLTSIPDANGRFLFGDGQFGFMPEDIVDRVRVSSCLPDATEDMTKGYGNLTSGSFIMAAAAWDASFKVVNHKPLFLEQFAGGSNAWCSMYHFGASDGSFIGCENAGKILAVQ